MTRARIRGRASGAGILLAVTLALAACSSTGSGGAAAGPVATNHVDLPKSYMFSPAAITVKAGTTVTWTNSDNFTHSVLFTGGPATSPDASQGQGLVMRPGQSASLTFSAPGSYLYKCFFHPQNMQGSVVVTG